ncbi:GNAT family N-acetyltransferase [Paenibacillus anaericanus]|uniref:GNAT family N-acetyltransferase n=1 Tax=Paenibacillus anaericanus TaxID=170367 RepID=A0A433Y5V7_9BACL|nr:GNAT family N-acetyltransferase [Paenibacillus anaericanus]RUT44423.1 GNAT family N-acetyltransferase [Paenibacillus anaericanus]
MLIYTTEELTVRELEKTDEVLLVTWLSNPVVLKYYEGRDRPHDLDLVREHFYKNDSVTRCIIEFEGKPIGFIQFYPLDEESRNEYGYINPDEKIYGTDQFIGEINYWNQGVGKKLVTSMTGYLINHKHADKIVMDPQTWNLRAIACYEKCGFKKIKLMKEHESHEGQLRDCWLIEYSALE